MGKKRATSTKEEHMSKTNDTATSLAEEATAEPGQRVQVNISLRPVEHSDKPVLSNFTMVQGAPGMVFVDFGFLEPQAFNAIAQAGRSGAKPPGALNGQLASRVAMNLQTATQLAQQLNGLLRRARPKPAAEAVEVPEAADAATLQ